jgi:AraC-like DNA-binding protein
MEKNADQSGIQMLYAPDSDLVINLSPVDRILRRTSLFAVGEHRCGAGHPLFESGGGPQPCPYIGFMRSTIMRTMSDARPEIHTPNVAGFHNIGSYYTRRAVDDTGDSNDWLAISPAFLADLAERQFDPGVNDGARFFRASYAPVNLGAYFALRRLTEVLDSGAEVSDLAFEEHVARLIGAVMREANAYWGTRDIRRRKPRPASERQRVAIVDAAKQLIATDYGANLSLDRLARGLHCSPGQLARIFPAQTGYTLHNYQQHIRMRAALQLLRESPFDVCNVAAQLGYASHSHFSTVFLQRFGITPSQYARSRPYRLDDTLLDALERYLLRSTAAPHL